MDFSSIETESSGPMITGYITVQKTMGAGGSWTINVAKKGQPPTFMPLKITEGYCGIIRG